LTASIISVNDINVKCPQCAGKKKVKQIGKVFAVKCLYCDGTGEVELSNQPPKAADRPQDGMTDEQLDQAW